MIFELSTIIPLSSSWYSFLERSTWPSSSLNSEASSPPAIPIILATRELIFYDDLKYVPGPHFQVLFEYSHSLFRVDVLNLDFFFLSPLDRARKSSEFLISLL